MTQISKEERRIVDDCMPNLCELIAEHQRVAEYWDKLTDSDFRMQLPEANYEELKAARSSEQRKAVLHKFIRDVMDDPGAAGEAASLDLRFRVRDAQMDIEMKQLYIWIAAPSIH